MGLRRRPRSRGMALGVVLAVLFIVMAITFSVSNSAVTTMQLSNNERKMSLAQYAAESGLSNAFSQLRANTAWSAGFTNQSMYHQLGDGNAPETVTYTVTVYNNSLSSTSQTASDGTVVAPGYIYMIAVGTCENCTRTTTLMSYVPASNTGVFVNAVETIGDISLAGGAVVDSFNSANGSYSSATAGNHGNMASGGNLSGSGSNTAIDGIVSTQGNLSLNGGATINLPSNATVQVKGSVSGYAGAVTTPTPLPSPSPVSCTYNSANNDALIACVPANKLSIDSSHNYKQTGGTAVLTAGTYYFNDFSVSGGGTVFVASGPVKIFCTGKINFSGGSAINNNTGIASNVQIFDSYSGTNGVSLSGGSNAYYVVYAPQTDVSFSGGSDFYGAVVAQSTTDTGGTNLHYDVALATLQIGTSSVQPVKITAWNRQ